MRSPQPALGSLFHRDACSFRASLVGKREPHELISTYRCLAPSTVSLFAATIEASTGNNRSSESGMELVVQDEEVWKRHMESARVFVPPKYFDSSRLEVRFGQQNLRPPGHPEVQEAVSSLL